MSDPFNEVLRETFGDTARKLLMEMVKRGCEGFRADTDRTYLECFHCGAFLREGWDAPSGPHAPNCPYADAIALFGDPNDKNRPVGVMKAGK